MADPIYNNAAWARVRRQVLARDHGRCQVRGTACLDKATAVDHIVPWRQGGAWYDLANLRAVCGPCNSQLVHTPHVGKRTPSRDWLSRA